MSITSASIQLIASAPKSGLPACLRPRKKKTYENANAARLSVAPLGTSKALHGPKDSFGDLVFSLLKLCSQPGPLPSSTSPDVKRYRTEARPKRVVRSTWGICTRRAGKLYKARSRLSRSQILQVNTRWKALAEIYTMHSFAPFSDLIFLFRKLLF